MNSLEGANCADLPGFVIDKYFDCNASTEPLRRDVALAICGRCVVREVCRDEALNAPNRRERGVIGGVTAGELARARAWRSYEQGIIDAPPSGPRPDWLARTDATETAEQARLEADTDEPEAYNFSEAASRGERAVMTHTSQVRSARKLHTAESAKRKTSRPKPLRLQRFNVDVPVPLPGANCADMPRELVQKYFDADVLRQSAAARVAMAVCDHCVILETCRQRALNGSNVRESGVIAGMAARELKRGRLWRRYEQGRGGKRPTSDRPSWLARTAASDQFDSQLPTNPDVIATDAPS